MIALLIAAATLAAADPPPDRTLSTADLLAARDAWPDWRESGAVLRVEGRVRGVAGETLRLERLPLTVRPAAGATLGRADARTRRVEITGRLAGGATGTFLEATAVRVIPSDDAEFTERSAAADKRDPAALDALAEWGETRAAFYDDRSLARRAELVRTRAFELRWDAAGEAEGPVAGAPAGRPPAVAARLGLLDSPAAATLPGRFRLTRTHDVLRTWWSAVRDEPAADLAALTGAVLTRLPGADRPAPDADADLLAAYAADPRDAYRTAPDEARRALHRAFFALAERERIERSAAPDGRDGVAVAARLEARLPELPELAESYRRRELAWRLARVESATRAEAIELANLLAARGDAAGAGRARREWLVAREKSLRGEGVNGLIRAAEEYRAVADDADAAARLLREAYALAPPGTAAEEEVAGRLRALGLTRAGDRWLDAGAAPDAPPDPGEAAVRAGRVAVGMTADQVRRALGGPTSTTRAATGLSVAEVWVYGRPGAGFGGGGGLAVHLERPRDRPADDAKVVAVHRL